MPPKRGAKSLGYSGASDEWSMCPVDWAPFRDGRLKSTDFMPPQSMPSICFTRLDHSRPRFEKKRAATLHRGFMRLHCVLVSSQDHDSLIQLYLCNRSSNRSLTDLAVFQIAGLSRYGC